MEGALTGGSIQAAEWSFSIGAYTSMAANPHVIENSTLAYSWFGIAFNYLKWPGDSVNFRRAIQFLQWYADIQATILQGVEGTATADPLACAAYSLACNPTVMASHYSYNITKAGLELEQVPGLQCMNGVNPCNGVYSGSSSWTCTGLAGTGCAASAPFSPNLYYRTTHYRTPWALAIISYALTIGFTIHGVSLTSSTVGAACFNPNALEVNAPGVYNAGTGYNSNPNLNATNIAADHCDMYTYGFVSSTPILNGLLESYDSQFAGTTTNTGNIYDNSTFVTPADAVAGYAAATTHTTVNNLDYTVNKVLYAPDAATANTWSQNFLIAYALQIPTVLGYYENTLYADNANGWTNFGAIPSTGANELGGLYWTLMNVHACGSATCTLGAVNGGTLGGSVNLALEQVSDQSGMNPIYNGNWAWQADVFENVFDTPLATPPSQMNNVNAFMGYMTHSYNVINLPGVTSLGHGAKWYYFQEPCGAIILKCQGHAFSSPGPLQHGVGLGATITNGQEVIYNLKTNIYFLDGVKVTPKDIVFSLDFFNVAASPNYPDTGSPASGVLGGANGLIAAQYINSTAVGLYLGTASFWNLGNTVPYVLPYHLWMYFNPDHVSTVALGTVDTSKPYSQAATTFSVQGAPKTPPCPLTGCTKWIYYLNNLEIGSGPFYIASWNSLSGTGQLNANPFYFNPNWQAMALFNNNFTQSGSNYVLNAQLSVPIFNPNTSPLVCATGSLTGGSAGTCILKGTMSHISWAAAGANKVKVYNAAGVLVRSLSLSKNTLTATYSSTVPTGLAKLNGASCLTPSASCYTLPSGSYKVVLQTTYSFFGQARTWYQVFSFHF
ncbi:MAG: hypothetical protein ABSB26_00660 [Nitrososphaerales archaeon]|jgi:hypothetical protein